MPNPLTVIAVALASTLVGFATPTGEALERQIAAIFLPPVP